MSVEGVLAAGRAAALQLMRDTCIIERRDGDPVLNDTTGQLEQAYTTVYSGQCRVKPFGRAGQTPGTESQWGDHEVTLHQYVCVVPWDTTPAVRREDRVTVTSSDDTWLIGRHLEVVDVGLSGSATARRMVVEDKEG